jgi:dTDP-4-dehydrorhamnose 3,5-epimerase
MIIRELPLQGLFAVEIEPHADERGLFARTYDAEAFAAQGLNPAIAQCSTSFNKAKGSLRGLHFQLPPHGEDKLVRCTRGAIFDVAVDVRPESPTYLQWHAESLSAENRRAMYICQGLAHGFLTLEPESEVFYQIAQPFEPNAARGLRWDDPKIGIDWPFAPAVLSERDRSFALLP